MKRTVRLITLLFSIFFLITSCKETKVKKEDNRVIFRYNEAAGITSLDPAFARTQANIWAVNQLYNGLVQMNDSLEVIPCIAKSWEILKGGMVYKFHLRNDVYFHDDLLFAGGKGRKVVAQDFVHSFYRILDPEISSPGVWIFSNVKRSGKEAYFGFEAPDDTTLIITLNKPFPPFLGLLTMQYCSVVPMEVAEVHGKEFRINPVGTGPFKYKMWKEGVKLILVKNEKYFEKDGDQPLPYLDVVEISFMPDKQTEFLSFLRGNIDFLSGIEGSYKDELLTKFGELQSTYYNKFKMESMPYLNTEYLGIQMDPVMDIVKNSPLRKKEIRQAINYGFDRDKMIVYLRNNIGIAAHAGFLPPGLPSFDESKVKGYFYDPEKAKLLMKKAGYPEGKDIPEITLHTTPQYKDLCEYIQEQLHNIGFKIKIEVSQAAQHKEMVARCRINFFRGSWIADYPDAENYLALFYSKNFTPEGPNYTHFKNSTFDKLYEKSLIEKDAEKRYEYYRQMDRIIIEEAPVIVMYYDEVIRLVQNNIEGLPLNAMNLLSLKKVKKFSGTIEVPPKPVKNMKNAR